MSYTGVIAAIVIGWSAVGTRPAVPNAADNVQGNKIAKIQPK